MGASVLKYTAAGGDIEQGEACGLRRGEKECRYRMPSRLVSTLSSRYKGTIFNDSAQLVATG